MSAGRFLARAGESNEICGLLADINPSSFMLLIARRAAMVCAWQDGLPVRPPFRCFMLWKLLRSVFCANFQETSKVQRRGINGFKSKKADTSRTKGES